MPTAALQFVSCTSFDEGEQATLLKLWDALQGSHHRERDKFIQRIADTVERTDALAKALNHYPPIFSETVLGRRRRSLDTLVDHLATATDANQELLLPTRALVGRTLLMAELNSWRQFSYICDEILDADNPTRGPLQDEIDAWLHSCIYTKCAEEVLSSISQDSGMDRSIRSKAVASLARLWENRLNYRVRDFFPLLEATWDARRRIRISVGTLLGVSEIFRLLQAGCDPEFVDYFSRPRCTEDERDAFLEFLIGVPTEEIQSLAQLMKSRDQTCMSPEEAARVLDPEGQLEGPASDAVSAYEFFRSRYLQAAARRLKDLPGPKRTAEAYVMVYYLDRRHKEDRVPA